jgi:hypothetical protein
MDVGQLSKSIEGLNYVGTKRGRAFRTGKPLVLLILAFFA